MKRKDIDRKLKELGWYQVKGKKHDKFKHERTSHSIHVPRSKEVDEFTAKSILRDAENHIK